MKVCQLDSLSNMKRENNNVITIHVGAGISQLVYCVGCGLKNRSI
jgi:hypothetical protein